MDSFRDTEFKIDGDSILRIHHWGYNDGESEEIKERVFERPEYNPNSESTDAEFRFWEENAEFAVMACNSFYALLDALMEIAKGEGAFSRDPLTFANNTIENMKEIANTAIAQAEVT